MNEKYLSYGLPLHWGYTYVIATTGLQCVCVRARACVCVCVYWRIGDGLGNVTLGCVPPGNAILIFPEWVLHGSIFLIGILY